MGGRCSDVFPPEPNALDVSALGPCKDNKRKGKIKNSHNNSHLKSFTAFANSNPFAHHSLHWASVQ